MSTAPHLRDGALWFSLLGGPAAWTLHLLASYPLVPLACDLETTLPLNLLTAGTALIAAAAAITGWVALRKVRRASADIADAAAAAPDPAGQRESVRGRTRFMAAAGTILGLFFTYVILIEGLPPLLQDACNRGL